MATTDEQPEVVVTRQTHGVLWTAMVSASQFWPAPLQAEDQSEPGEYASFRGDMVADGALPLIAAQQARIVALEQEVAEIKASMAYRHSLIGRTQRRVEALENAVRYVLMEEVSSPAARMLRAALASAPPPNEESNRG